MSDEKTKKDLQKVEQGKKATIKLEAVRAAKEISNPDSTWTLPQEILQEVMAGYIVSNPDKRPAVSRMTEDLKKEIEIRYKEDEEIKKILLESVPSARSIAKWIEKDGWEEAVWERIRGDKLFSAASRAEVIQAVKKRAVEKSDNAAKLYLTLSGDYQEKIEVNDKTVETYREIQKTLLRKSRNEE
jgi:hypothetical protein